MHRFDVKDPSLDLMNSHFLEASAGTGKTFAIEHLFIRLLLEKNIPVDQILVVTFTKAATQELKCRIRNALEKRLEDPSVKKKIERALNLFDDAKIMTIHSFCFQSLFSEALEPLETNREALFSLVKDYLRCEISHLPPQQIDRLLRKYMYNFDMLVKDLLKMALKRIPIQRGASFTELQSKISAEVEKIKIHYSLEREKVLHDLFLLAPCFSDMCTRQKEVKEHVQEEFFTLCSLFEGEKVDLFSFKALLGMQEENRLKRPLPDGLNYKDLLKRLQEDIFPLIGNLSDELLTFASLAEGVRKHIEKDPSIFYHDDLLFQMKKRVEDPLFAARVRGSLQAAFIDEFQDTDRWQWEIFSTLFMHKIPLYLIGDPKQSIYRFRGADIYTYFEARKTISQTATLGRNYRSEPRLVHALNLLFTSEKPLLMLPKRQESYDYLPVDHDPEKKDSIWKDGKGAIHFLEGEREEDFFPFIVDEIRFLAQEMKIPLGECAILVKDRFQAERFQKYATKMGLLTALKKSYSLVNTKAFNALCDLIDGLMHLHKKGRIEKILMGPLFTIPHSLIAEKKREMMQALISFKRTLLEKGILSCSKLLEEGGYYEKIVGQEGGVTFLNDFQQLVDILEEKETSPEEYLFFLHKLTTLSDETEWLQAYSQGMEEAVSVMTTHASKGLEFDIVFGLGLTFAAHEKRELFYDETLKCFIAPKTYPEQEKEEMQGEALRLFYVGATRARKRVYLPFLKKEKDSPLSLFLRNRSLESFLPAITTSKCEKNRVVRQGTDYINVSLTPPKELSIKFNPLFLSSFSRENLAHIPLIKKEIKSLLPQGKEMGSFLHALFEKLPFEAPQPFLNTFIENSPYNTLKEEIEKIVFHTLHAQLLPDLSLSAVDPKKMLREKEFMFQAQEKFLKGFIDLIFEHEKKIYIVDWKSNTLSDYHEEALLEEMESHNYFLQQKIYKVCVQKYISLFPDLSFGGSFYIFLRGVRAHEKEGVFYIP